MMKSTSFSEKTEALSETAKLEKHSLQCELHRPKPAVQKVAVFLGLITQPRETFNNLNVSLKSPSAQNIIQLSDPILQI